MRSVVLAACLAALAGVALGQIGHGGSVGPADARRAHAMAMQTKANLETKALTAFRKAKAVLSDGSSRGRRQSQTARCPGSIPEPSLDAAKAACPGVFALIPSMPEGQEPTTAQAFAAYSPGCIAFFCQNGVFGQFKGACTSVCQNVFTTFQEAIGRNGSYVQEVVNDDDGADDDEPEGQATCFLEQFTEGSEGIQELKPLCKFYADPDFKLIYKAIALDNEFQCGMTGEQSACNTDCDCNDPDNPNRRGGRDVGAICVARQCQLKCRTDFFSPAAETFCDPCNEECKAGYCQSTDAPGTGEAALDPLVVGVELFIDSVQAMCHVEKGKHCLDDVTVLEKHADAGSGTFAVAVDGLTCSSHELQTGNEKQDFTAVLTGTTLVLTSYLGSAGTCREKFLDHTMVLDQPCAQIIDTLAPGVSLPAGATVSQVTGDPVYGTATMVNGKASVTYSTNKDCSPTTGQFNKEFCGALGTELDAGSCCIETFQEAMACISPAVEGVRYDKIFKEAAAVCGKTGNTAICANTKIPSQCRNKAEEEAAAVVEKKSIQIKLDSTQVSQWDSLTVEQKEQAVGLLFGVQAAQLDGPVKVSGGELVIAVEGTKKDIAATQQKVNNAGDGGNSGGKIEVAVGGKTVSTDAAAAKSSVPPPPPVPPPASSNSAAAVRAAAAAAVASAGLALLW